MVRFQTSDEKRRFEYRGLRFEEWRQRDGQPSGNQTIILKKARFCLPVIYPNKYKEKTPRGLMI